MTDHDTGATGKPGRKAPKATSGAPKPVVVNTKPARSGVSLRKKDFIDRAAETSGIRKSDARMAIDAALTVLADALAAGDEVILPPLGKLRVMREKDNGKARIMTLRLQIIPDADGPPKDGNDPLAEPRDDS